jgi:hypothetical protein
VHAAHQPGPRPRRQWNALVKRGDTDGEAQGRHVDNGIGVLERRGSPTAGGVPEPKSDLDTGGVGDDNVVHGLDRLVFVQLHEAIDRKSRLRQHLIALAVKALPPAHRLRGVCLWVALAVAVLTCSLGVFGGFSGAGLLG